MKNLKNILSIIGIASLILMVSAYSTNDNSSKSYCAVGLEKTSMNMFVTHGHCSLPFAAKLENLKVDIPSRKDFGNPLENMNLSFEMNPKSFRECRGDGISEELIMPGLFHDENHEKIMFRSTNIYTMGVDWYQINGLMTIKGVEKEVKFFASGIRQAEERLAGKLVLESQIDLLDWGIDYEKIVHSDSRDLKTKWMHFNMQLDLSKKAI